MTRLKEKYTREALPVLLERFDYTSVMAAPRVTKIVLNMGLGKEASANPKAIETAQGDLAVIAGQMPVVTRAKRSIANFKLRAGMPVGLKVTLRGERMYNFLDKLVTIVLPRMREFRGVPVNAFDGRGSYALGLKEQTVFPEIDFSKIDKLRGMEVNIVTSARRDEEARVLLELLGMPFSRD